MNQEFNEGDQDLVQGRDNTNFDKPLKEAFECPHCGAYTYIAHRVRIISQNRKIDLCPDCCDIARTENRNWIEHNK